MISLKDISFHISLNSLGLYLSPEFLLNFFSNFYIPPCLRKIFKFMEFIFIENALIWGIFTQPLSHSKLAPTFLSSRPGQKEITHSPRQHSSKIFFPEQHKRVEETIFALSKLSQKMWRWLGTLGFLYFAWFVLFFQMWWFSSIANNIYHIVCY